MYPAIQVLKVPTTGFEQMLQPGALSLPVSGAPLHGQVRGITFCFEILKWDPKDIFGLKTPAQVP